MHFSEAQHDIRRAYVGGGPGVLVSALTWFVAAFIQHGHGVGAAFVALFIGGMFIFPVGKLVSRFLFKRASEAKRNPLGMTALESTVAMIGGLFAAWLFLPVKPLLVFPLAAIAVGTHYLVFRTVYGDRLFLALAAIVTALGLVDILVLPIPGGVALSVAVAELVFGLVLTMRATRA
ncbi:MAG: hypothetical protein WC804_13850 [Sphingomonas sp.]|jgi:hypothetical protein|uniref:DUF7010 family protein n=1 Tax=Sphingomonas sp. TaxID=28214 RepID=UPI0035660ECD